MNKVLFSSQKDNWETPQELFDELNKKYKFNLDPCSNEENYKCKNHYTIKENGLIQEWGTSTFCNPPYGRQIYNWIKKADQENKKGNNIVLLLPARTDTKWFHEFIYKKHEIIFLKGRLKFSNKNSAPFPSMIVIMKGNKNENI